MSTVAEVTEVLPKLSDDELRVVERRLGELLRKRNIGIVLADSYGTLTELDLAKLADEALAEIDRKPEPK